MGEVGDVVERGWVAEPEHWSVLTARDVVEYGGGLAAVSNVGAYEGRRWLQLWTGEMVNLWAEPGLDPLAMVLRPRDVLAGEVIVSETGADAREGPAS